MSQTVEVRQGESVTSLVDELATAVADDSLTIPADRAIEKGEWVRFTIRLEDGTDVMEGVGRSRGSMPRGNPVSHHDLVLGDLQFDERNEIMWERLLIAAESARSGDETGTIPLGEGGMEEIRPDVPAGQASAPGASPRSPSVPPLPAKPLGGPRPPSKASPAAKSQQPPSRPSKPPALPATPASAASPATGASAAPPAGHRLEVPAELVARARKLGGGSMPENDVLSTALRMGLAALEAQKA